MHPHYLFSLRISALQCLCCSEKCHDLIHSLWHKWFASKWVISRRRTFGIAESNTQLCFMRGQHTCKQSLNLLSSSLTEQNLAMLKHRIWNCYQFNAIQESKILLFKWAEKTSCSEVPGSKLSVIKFLQNHFNSICMSVKYQWETNALCSDSSGFSYFNTKPVLWHQYLLPMLPAASQDRTTEQWIHFSNNNRGTDRLFVHPSGVLWDTKRSTSKSFKCKQWMPRNVLLLPDEKMYG